MPKNIDKMGVLVLMSHLLITLAFIGVYLYTLATGQEDETLRTILTVIVGYWFGAMGKEAIRPTTRVDKVDNMELNQEKGA